MKQENLDLNPPALSKGDQENNGDVAEHMPTVRATDTVDLLGTKDNNVVIKHRAAVQTCNSVSLLGRQIWNVLLANAYSDLLRKDHFTVNIKELADVLKFDHRNLKYLRDQVRQLIGAVTEWDLLDKTGDWEAYSMLSSAKIENRTILHYSYDRDLKLKLYNPTTYAKISLAIQRQFKSKYSLALYELCVSCFMAKRGQGETSWISIADYRRIMNIHNDKHYDEFKYVNRTAITAPVKEINEASDLRVTVSYQRAGRGVTHVKFLIRAASESSNELLRKLKQIKKASERERLPLGDNSINAQLYDRLLRLGFKDKQIEMLMKTYKDREDYVNETLDLVDIKLRAGVITKNLPGYVVSALRDDYRPTGDLKEKLSKDRIAEDIKKEAAKNKEVEKQLAENRYYQYKEEMALDYLNSLSIEEKDRLIELHLYGLDLYDKTLLGKYKDLKAAGKTMLERPPLRAKLVNYIVENYIRERVLPFKEFGGGGKI